MSEPPPKVTKSERALLRQLAQEAWEAELDDNLEQLFEDFSRWADDGMSAFELSDRIHDFHNGASRELYSRYTGLNSVTAVARAIALGILDEGALGDTLRMKLSAPRYLGDVPDPRGGIRCVLAGKQHAA